jgi:hypothetical protein
MPSVSVRTARKDRPCRSYPCRRTIQQGERYRRYVAFPGDDGHEQGTQPWVMDECTACAQRRGEPIEEGQSQ